MPAQNVRFGAFRLDLETGELFDDGRKVQLQEQPFKILKMLLEHPGEVVTREEIRRTLWSDDTIVEFDNSVNAAIKKLRSALGDSAESPMYVETLPRKGYRFIFPLKRFGSGGSNIRPFLTEQSAPESMVDWQNLEGDSSLLSSGLQATAQEIVEARASSLGGKVIGPYPIARELESDLKRLSRRLDIERDLAGSEALERREATPEEPERSGEKIQKRPMRARWAQVLGYRPVFWIALLLPAATVMMLFAISLRSPLPAPTVLAISQITNKGALGNHILLTDGVRIYYSGFEGRRPRPVSVSVNGGEAVPIPMSLPAASVLDISPLGNELLVKSGGDLWKSGPLWVLPTIGGIARRLGDLEALEATWSPDGKELIYSKGNGLYFAKSNGTGSRKLLSMPAHPILLRRSPDGRRLSVTLENYPEAGHSSLWELSSDGSNLHPRLPEWSSAPSNDCDGCWTADGKYFLFSSDRGGGGIWAIREKGGFFEKWSREPVRLTTMHTGRPLPSKDGKRVFFVSVFGKMYDQLMRHDSRKGQWVPYLGGISAEQVAFSRDRQWITYVSYPGANLVRSKVDGSQQVQLTSAPVECSKPRWSPDGKRIAYMARGPGEAWKIWVASAEGTSNQPLIGGPSPSKALSTGKLQGNAHCAGECDPDWSPDGRSLVFYRQPTAEEDAANAMPIHILDLRTNRVKRLSGSGDRYYPHWSPDGRYLVTTADHFKKTMLFDFKTQRWIELTEGGNLYYPSWSRDGQSIYFIDWTKDKRGYYRAGIHTHRLERVTELNTPAPIENGTDGGWVGLGEDDSPIALFSYLGVGHNEIHALDWVVP